MVDVAQSLFKGKLCEMENVEIYEDNVNNAQEPSQLVQTIS